MILNDVGAQWDNHAMTDVSRGWPCNGKFSEQADALLYDMRAGDLQPHVLHHQARHAPWRTWTATISPLQRRASEGRRACWTTVDDIGKYMWHGGAHHVGYDVHDAVETPETVAPGMVFCVDIGIYHEEWGIGFRLEDNCLVTEGGCENLSAMTPADHRRH